MRRFALATMVATTMLLAIPASATTPESVHFDVPTFFGVTNNFTASGDAVDSGLMCASGTVDDLFGKATGASPAGINFQVVKLFTCDDDSGSFLVKLQVRLDHKGDNFQWVVLWGDGAYTDLHGSGNGIGIEPDVDFVRDLYFGKVHSD